MLATEFFILWRRSVSQTVALTAAVDAAVAKIAAKANARKPKKFTMSDKNEAHIAAAAKARWAKVKAAAAKK